uniref:C2H2-type domain-containing protein n=1 Tax=Sexangularia sp. CB-2014 TaxID=1486929 RepID=A0A7S1V4G3_9EUKA|mmetsp:Transcript_11499/g.36541  ORF Transcript_11499/g.36541 Transcript_11499/m.36541 type:complete len:619 (+) Transcript_11499:38-1894(+)
MSKRESSFDSLLELACADSASSSSAKRQRTSSHESSSASAAPHGVEPPPPSQEPMMRKFSDDASAPGTPPPLSRSPTLEGSIDKGGTIALPFSAGPATRPNSTNGRALSPLCSDASSANSSAATSEVSDHDVMEGATNSEADSRSDNDEADDDTPREDRMVMLRVRGTDADGNSKQHGGFVVTRKDGRWVCPMDGCAHSYTHRSALRVHLHSIHLGRRYPCPVPGCDLAFVTSSHVQRHIKSKHHGLKYRCSYPLCDMEFSSRSHARRHRVKQHPPVIAQCSQRGCDMEFLSLAEKQQHEVAHDASAQHDGLQLAQAGQPMPQHLAVMQPAQAVPPGPAPTLMPHAPRPQYGGSGMMQQHSLPRAPPQMHPMPVMHAPPPAIGSAVFGGIPAAGTGRPSAAQLLQQHQQQHHQQQQQQQQIQQHQQQQQQQRQQHHHHHHGAHMRSSAGSSPGSSVQVAVTAPSQPPPTSGYAGASLAPPELALGGAPASNFNSARSSMRDTSPRGGHPSPALALRKASIQPNLPRPPAGSQAPAPNLPTVTRNPALSNATPPTTGATVAGLEAFVSGGAGPGFSLAPRASNPAVPRQRPDDDDNDDDDSDAPTGRTVEGLEAFLGKK